MNIRAWLSQLGVSQYTEAFEANDIDVALLPDITDQVLKDIGIASAGHRVKILKAIAELKMDQSSVPSSAQIECMIHGRRTGFRRMGETHRADRGIAHQTT